MELNEFRRQEIERRVTELQKQVGELEDEIIELREKVKMPIAMIYGAAGTMITTIIILIITYVYGNTKK